MTANITISSLTPPGSHYPMLARIWDMYIDVGYKAGEVAALRSECMTLKLRVSNQDALTWLHQLLSACDLALQKNLGVYLACH